MTRRVVVRGAIAAETTDRGSRISTLQGVTRGTLYGPAS